MNQLMIHHYLGLSAILFIIASIGLFINRRNLMIVLMCVELILLAIVINFVTFSTALDDLSGQIYTLFLLTIAGAESAIGLAIILVYFRRRGSIAIQDINELK